MPTVSIIIPTYNRGSLLPEAIESVLKQTFDDYELLIIDDGSTDNTKEIVKEFSADTIRYYHQSNKGVSAARNLGIQKARGELICFLDSDDYWLPTKLAKQIAFQEAHPKYRIHQTDEIWMRKPRRVKPVESAAGGAALPQFHRVNPMKKHTKYGGMIYEQCLPLCLITPSSVMIHRTLFDEVGLFDESLPACEDYDLWLRITWKYEVGLLPEKLIVKRGGHADQLSNQFIGIDRFRIQALGKILQAHVLSPDQHTATMKQIARKCTIYATGCLKHGKYEEGQRYQSFIEELAQ